MVPTPRSLRSALILSALLPLGLSAQISGGDPPARVGRISSLLGNVSFQAAGSSDWSVATLNYTVTTGDRLLTGQGARGEMEVGPFAVRLADSTDVNVVNLTDNFAQIGLTQGTVRISVYRITRGDSMEVDTPNGALIIRQAGDYRIETPQNGNSTFVTVDAGILDVSGPGLDATMRAGQAFELNGTNPIRLTSVSRPRQTDFDRWSADRDHRYEISDCSRYVNRDIPGCADLSEHGTWDEHTVYGPVWYPTRVVVGWVPYRYGRWVWIEPWGWTWVEEEPWGFAPFHYGRWVWIGSRWGWAPGPIMVRPYYGPAFVTFVGGPGYGFGIGIGVHAWFPLGPRDPYFPWYHHGDRYLRDVNYANVRNVTAINIFVDQRNTGHRFEHRDRGTTVVATETFRSGRPVGREVVNVRADEIARAPIAQHPWVTPTHEAAIGGRAEAPVIARPRTVAYERPREAPVREQPREAQTPTRSPLISRNPAPQSSGPSPRQAGSPGTTEGRTGETRTGDGRTADPKPVAGRPADSKPVAGRPADSKPVIARPTDSRPPESRPPDSKPVIARPTDSRPPESRPSADPASRGRPLITRSAPPPDTPPYDARERAMQRDPGRPLSPQQMDNVRRGQEPSAPTQARERERPSQSQGQSSGQLSGRSQPQSKPQSSSRPTTSGGTASRKPPV